MTACERWLTTGSLERRRQVAAADVLRCEENVADQIRVMTSKQGHRYDRALYAPMAERVRQVALPGSFSDTERELLAALEGVDIFHMHWPEFVCGPNRQGHVRLIELLEERNVQIVWTQHNLLPHAGHRAWPGIYQLWADAAMGVIHHSRWGMERALGARSYRPDALHRVIRHGHWGAARVNREALDRDELARPYKMAPERTHLGIIGAPRPAKDIRMAVDGFLESGRDDLDLTIFSLGEGETLPRHPRLLGRPHKFVDRDVFNRRLAFIDILLFPIRPDGTMLTTGLVGDAIAVAKPAIVSDWPFLTETFGDAAIEFGSDAAGLSRCLAELDLSTLDDRSVAMRALQPEYAWERSAEATLELFEELLDRR
jgi:glycosyltransferase involved in cell wall biosynthesis